MSQQFGNIRVTTAVDARTVNYTMANVLALKIKTKPDMVLGLGTGGTMEPIYQSFVQDELPFWDVSFAEIRTFNVDEYVGLAAGHPQSYRWFMYANLFSGTDIDPANCNFPLSGGEAYENAIKDAGGIDLLVTGIGRNGHLGFNEPGSEVTSRTREVQLDEDTRIANARFFESVDEVPTSAISMGIATMLDAKQVIIVATGREKAQAVHDALTGEITPDVPASFLQLHSDCKFVIDREAASLLAERSQELELNFRLR